MGRFCDQKTRDFCRTSMLAIGAWTAILAMALVWHYFETRKHMLTIARETAAESIRKDLLFRRWTARHGGVYVPVTETTPPNPHLSHVKERDLTTATGRRLTLMNPAYVMRQLHELASDRHEQAGHLVSLTPRNPKNAPDEWDAAALRGMKEDGKEVQGLFTVAGEEYFRLLQPMRMEGECLKCHADQGYREDDLHGGISVSIPMKPIRAMIREQVKEDVLRLSLLWLAGLAAILMGSLFLRRRVVERQRAIEALTASEARYRALFEQAGDYALILLLGEDGIPRIADVNEATLRAHGYEREELLGKPISFIEQEPQGPSEEMKEILEGGGEVLFPVRHRRKDGTCFDAEVRAKMMDVGGERFLLAVERDITDRKQAEHALRESEERWRSIVENEPECIKLLDREGRLLEMNPAGLAMIGATIGKVRGQRTVDLVVEEDRPAFDDMVAAVFRGETRKLEFRATGLQGRRLILETISVPLRDGGGTNVRAMLGVTRDVTGRMQLEEQLRQAQKMEAIGLLAGGIAHDFNNLIQAISTFNFLLRMELEDNSLPVTFAEEQEAVIRRATELIGALLTFSRRQASKPKVQDVNRIIRDARNLLRRMITEDITVEMKLASGELHASVDEVQINQVLMNLATNGRDAMPKGGTLVISTARVRPESDFRARHGCDGECVLISVTDTGHGMDSESASRIFEPFYTTKEAGKGTGLGLAIIYGIIQQHRGIIEVDTAPGAGTSFRIYLPLVSDRADDRQPDITNLPRRGTETILLAEDEAMVRRGIREVLASFGYTVLEASDGDEAVRLFREHHGTIDLVIMDMVMPGKNGAETMEEIRGISPAAKSIFLSGYEAGVLEKKGVGEKQLVLKKPVDTHLLLETIRSVLDGPGTLPEAPVPSGGEAAYGV